MICRDSPKNAGVSANRPHLAIGQGRCRTFAALLAEHVNAMSQVIQARAILKIANHVVGLIAINMVDLRTIHRWRPDVRSHHKTMDKAMGWLFAWARQF